MRAHIFSRASSLWLNWSVKSPYLSDLRDDAAYFAAQLRGPHQIRFVRFPPQREGKQHILGLANATDQLVPAEAHDGSSSKQ